MMIRTANVADITAAVKLQLQQALPYSEGDIFVERSEPVSAIPGRTPWVGIYRQAVRTIPRTLGLGPGYRQQRIELVLVCVEQSMKSGEACEVALEAFVQNMVSALLSDESLRGTVDTLDELAVTYSDYRKEGTAFLQEAVVQFTAIVNVTAIG